VKALPSRTVILRCNSHGPLYPLRGPSSSPGALLATTTPSLWHRRLGHPGHHTLSRLHQSKSISYNKEGPSLCHACQLGKHVRLPFYASQSYTIRLFQLLHCDLWTSPIPSNSGFRYFLIIVDDFSHYFWSFPLRQKSDVYTTLVAFHAYAKTHFNLPILAIQCDNGGEFVNTRLDHF
jgi:hypothetical protein